MGALASVPMTLQEEEEEEEDHHNNNNNNNNKDDKEGRKERGEKKRAGKKKHKCIIVREVDGQRQLLDNDDDGKQHILHRKSILQIVWTLPKRLRMSWRLLFDSKKDGTSFAKLVETLTAVDATSFCIAVEVKEPRSGHPEIFGACVVFPKGQGLKANATEWRKYGATAESYLLSLIHI